MAEMVIISTDFFESFIKLPLIIQNKVRDFFDKFANDPHLKSINLEKINKISGKQLYSVRIDDTYRGIVFKEEQNIIYHLLWVDHHDKAYGWAKNKQELNLKDTEAVVYPASYYISMGLSPKRSSKIFDKISSKDLLKLGVPIQYIEFIKNIPSVNAFEAIKELLPKDVFSNLEFIAYGFHVKDILEDEERKTRHLIEYIENKVTKPALRNEYLDNDIKESMEHTLTVLKSKKTVKEILDFFNYALDAKRGKQIYKALNKLGLKAFEDIKDEFENMRLI
jgi:hypothetical protein